MSACQRSGFPAPTKTAVAGIPIFDALADPNRLCLLDRLRELGPCSTKRLTEVIPLTRQAATKHLQTLEAVALVDSKRRGRQRIWSIHPETLDLAGDYLMQLAHRGHCADRTRKALAR